VLAKVQDLRSYTLFDRIELHIVTSVTQKVKE